MTSIQCSLDVLSDDLKKLSFVVPGEAVGKGRPKFTMQGGFAKAYTPKKTSDYEKFIKHCYRSKYRNYISDKAVKVMTFIYVKPAKSLSKKKRAKLLNNEFLPTKKPDVDNVQKCILDALNKVAFKDDVQVVDQVTMKRFGEENKVIVVIEEIGLTMQSI